MSIQNEPIIIPLFTKISMLYNYNLLAKVKKYAATTNLTRAIFLEGSKLLNMLGMTCTTRFFL
jgi:hypothetical protein